MADENTRQQIFPLPEGINIIGRKSSQSSQATIHIETADRTMSREHIRIEVRKDSKGFKHFLSDNNSKNHTLYNSSYLEKGEIVILNNNDEIIIGNTTLRFNE